MLVKGTYELGRRDEHKREERRDRKEEGERRRGEERRGEEKRGEEKGGEKKDIEKDGTRWMECSRWHLHQWEVLKQVGWQDDST